MICDAVNTPIELLSDNGGKSLCLEMPVILVLYNDVYFKVLDILEYSYNEM